jgi:hypothetical protein
MPVLQDDVDELELETDSLSGSPTYIAAAGRAGGRAGAAAAAGAGGNKRQTKEILAEQLRQASRRQAYVPKPKDAFTAALEHHEGRSYPGAGWRVGSWRGRRWEAREGGSMGGATS